MWRWFRIWIKIHCSPVSLIFTLEIIYMSSMGKNSTLYSTDLSKEMVTMAQERLKDDSRIIVQEADAMALAFDDSSMDAYLSNLCLHIVPDPDKMLQEASRVLKSGGRAGFSVWGAKANSPMFTIQSDVMRELGLTDKEPEHFVYFETCEELVRNTKRFEQYGFVNRITWIVPMVMADLRAVETLLREEAMGKLDSKVQQGILAKAESYLKSGKPIQLEIMVMVCEKA